MDPMGKIRRRAEDCQSLFSRCLSSPLFSELDWFENRQGEFNLWAASLKALSVGRPSLDYRLRDRPEVRELICDLLEGLSEALTSLLQPVTSTPEIEGDAVEDSGSVFSAFSTDGDDTASLPSIGKADGPFSEQMFSVKTILGQLARISTAIRRSGANYRYQKADASLEEERFQEFKTHLTIVILMGSIEAHTEEPVDNFAITAQVTDPSRLTAVQERLIHANIVRRNRIIFATRSMKAVEQPTLQQPQLRIIQAPDATAEPASQLPQVPTKAAFDKPVVSSQAPSIIAPSVAQTATEIGSQFNWEHVAESKKSPLSVMTKVTRTGAAQDYPSCPKPILDDILQCPYCADILPASYSKNMSRWKGHVAQDVLPHICIYNDCETPDRLYLTSDELLKHMLSHHSITRWVCDYCASESGEDQSFVFACVEDWQFHMKTEHATAFTPSQSLSLSKVSQRRMLEPLACPLCGYVAEHPTTTLDEHIAMHLHGFALRCLPWGTGGDEADSINAKSADASNSSELTDEDEDDSEYLNVTDANTPTRLYQILTKFSDAMPYDAQCSEKLIGLKRRLPQHLSFLESQATSRVQAGQMARQLSHPLPLVDLFPAPGSNSSHNQVRLDGNLLDYSSDASSSSPSPADGLSEAAVSHLFKITRILYQTALDWGTKRPKDAFELYCNEIRPSLRAKARDDDLDIEGELTQRWNDLSNSQKGEFEFKLDREIGGIAKYLAYNTEASQTILEDELAALDAVLLELMQQQLATSTSMKPVHQSYGSTIDPKEIKRFELTEVYSHPDAKADIVFVHGLNGDPRMTWQSKNGTFWPSQLLPISLKSAEARILVYGYNADVHAFGSDGDSPSSNAIYQHAQTMLTNLAFERESEEVEEHPIIFVAHSLGGIIVKRALELSYDIQAKRNENLRSIYVSTYGIIFLGTPHTGADPAKWGIILQRMVDALIPKKMMTSHPQLVRVLQASNETLQNINLHFLDIYQKFHICMAHEAQGTNLKGVQTLIVDQISAAPMLPGVTYFSIEATHAGMSKFDSKNSPGYTNVSATLRSWVQEAPRHVQLNWEQEMALRKWQRAAELSELPHPISPLPSSPPSSRVTAPHDVSDDPPYFIKPSGFRPNSLFVGRETELKDLHRMLFDKKRRMEGTSAVLIQSLPGGGKTHLAREYVYQHKDDFPGGIFWLRAKSKTELDGGFWDIARHVGLTDTRTGDELDYAYSLHLFNKRVRNWFNKRHDWLLILDGIHFSDELREFIPDSQNTSLIYTSTEKAINGEHHFINPQIIKLPLLSARQAQKLFLLDLGRREPFDQDDMKYSRELVQAMGFLPLVIHTVAQRLKATDEPLSKFVRSYSAELRLRGLGTYVGIVDQLNAIGAIEALNLVYVICFFSQHIPVEMISLGMRAIDVPVQARDPVFGHSMNNSFRVLSSFALIDRNEHDEPDDNASHDSKNSRDMLADNVDIIRLHSVVQGFFIDTLHAEGTLPIWLNRAIRAFCYSYDFANDRIDRKSNVGLVEDYRSYEIHGKRLQEHLTKYNTGRFSNRFTREQKTLLQDAQHLLEQRLLAIRAEIERRTLDASNLIAGGWSDTFQTSIFDRTSSSSDIGAETPEVEYLRSNISTWDFEPDGGRLSPESMTQDYTRRLAPSFGRQVPAPLSEYPGYDSDNQESAATDARPRRTMLESEPEPKIPGAWEIVRPRTRRPSISRPEDLSLHRTAKSLEQKRYHDSAGAFRSMISGDPRAMKGKATYLDARSSTETGTGYLQNRPSSSRGEQSEFERTSQSSAEASLVNIAKSSLPPPPSGGGSIADRRSSETRRSLRRWVPGAPSYAAAVAGVTRDTATSYKEPEPPDESGSNPT